VTPDVLVVGFGQQWGGSAFDQNKICDALDLEERPRGMMNEGDRKGQKYPAKWMARYAWYSYPPNGVPGIVKFLSCKGSR
jgi:hypothetical protein